jgi:hypothetical protein
VNALLRREVIPVDQQPCTTAISESMTRLKTMVSGDSRQRRHSSNEEASVFIVVNKFEQIKNKEKCR